MQGLENAGKGPARIRYPDDGPTTRWGTAWGRVRRDEQTARRGSGHPVRGGAFGESDLIFASDLDGVAAAELDRWVAIECPADEIGDFLTCHFRWIGATGPRCAPPVASANHQI